MSATKFRRVNLIYFTAIVSVLFLGYTEAEDDIKLTRHNNGDDPEDLEEREGMIRLSPPKLDDEEQNSPHIPKALRCDGCRAVAYQVKIHGWRVRQSPIILGAFVSLVKIHFPTSHLCRKIGCSISSWKQFKSMFLQRVDMTMGVGRGMCRITISLKICKFYL